MKVFKLINSNAMNLLSPRKKTKVIDWTLCFICQGEKKGEVLTDPSRNRRQSYDSFRSLPDNIQQFANFNGLPHYVDLEALQGSLNLTTSLEENHAVYHKTCSLMFNNSKLARLRKRLDSDKENAHSSGVTPTRSSLSLSRHKDDTCIFCDVPESRTHPLSVITSDEADKNLKECAVAVGNDKILVLAGGSTLKEYKYHKKCRINFLNQGRPKAEGNDDKRSQAHGVVLACMIDHMKDVRSQAPSNQPPAWKMVELTRLYSAEMAAHGVPCEGHSSRLREDLLMACDDLECTGSEGQHYLIAFRKDIDSSLRENCKRDFSEEGYVLSQAAAIVRRDLFSSEYNHENVPLSLKSLLKMLVRGCGLQSSQEQDDKVITTLSDLIYFHASKRGGSGKFTRHSKERETPTPVYAATKLYGETRNKGLVDVCHRLGCSISYKRLQSIIDEKASLTAQMYLQEGVVCPSALKKNVLTVGAADNVDHDTSSTTAKTSFHGTAISIMQFPSVDAPGERRSLPIAASPNIQLRSKRFDLPEDFANVRVSFLDPKQGKPSPSPNYSLEHCVPSDPSAFEGEKKWLEECLSATTGKTWSDFHSFEDNMNPQVKYKTDVAVLPLFHEQAHSVGMMTHCMGVVSKAVQHVNPGQIPVMVVDQPLYALCKSIQWQDASFAEDKFFVMLGGMHIELAALRSVGQWLSGSGWTAALVDAGVTTQGRADALTKALHLKRARYAHQVRTEYMCSK